MQRKIRMRIKIMNMIRSKRKSKRRIGFWNGMHWATEDFEVTLRWTWDASMHPGVASALTSSNWCNELEQSASDPIIGKVLCVCAGLAVAREVVGDSPANSSEALKLLDDWIDDPTVERFDRICDIIFGPDESVEVGPHGVIWWALRTATSSVGNFEAGWALSSTCGAAVASGHDPEVLRAVAMKGVLAKGCCVESNTSQKRAD
jgi:hypothetical protein